MFFFYSPEALTPDPDVLFAPQSGDPLRAPEVTPQEVQKVVDEAQRFMLSSHLMCVVL